MEDKLLGVGAAPLRSPIVGMKFHPPAEAVMGMLEAGTPLMLVAEPENRFDPDAVRVLVKAEEVLRGRTPADVDAALLPYGADYEEVLRQGLVMLGYLPREATVRKMGGPGLSSNREVLEAFGHRVERTYTHLTFDMRGWPVAEIWPGKGSEEEDE